MAIREVITSLKEPKEAAGYLNAALDDGDILSTIFQIEKTHSINVLQQ